MEHPTEAVIGVMILMSEAYYKSGDNLDRYYDDFYLATAQLDDDEVMELLEGIRRRHREANSKGLSGASRIYEAEENMVEHIIIERVRYDEKVQEEQIDRYT